MRSDQKVSQDELEDAFQQCDENGSGVINIAKLKVNYLKWNKILSLQTFKMIK